MHKPKAGKDVSQVRLASQWEEKWKAMMSVLGGDPKIPDLWRMSTLGNMPEGREGADHDETG